jgi:hypothetical protein
MKDELKSTTKSEDCPRCGKPISLPADTLALFAAWTPQRCMECASVPAPAPQPFAVPDATPAAPDGGPKAGIFTCGVAIPNPGPGAWSFVRVAGNAIVTEASGFEADTTTNRTALLSLIRALESAHPRETLTIYSPSELAVQSVTRWGPDWKRTSCSKPCSCSKAVPTPASHGCESPPSQAGSPTRTLSPAGSSSQAPTTPRPQRPPRAK